MSHDVIIFNLANKLNNRRVNQLRISRLSTNDGLNGDLNLDRSIALPYSPKISRISQNLYKKHDI